MTSHESTPTFQVRANMVLVRVVVRDSTRNSIGTLNRDDFEIFDNHRPQIISNFNVLKAKHDAAGQRLGQSCRSGDGRAVPLRIRAATILGSLL